MVERDPVTGVLRLLGELDFAVGASHRLHGGQAARRGFADPSRFSAHYRRAFGESPRDTLRG